MNEKKKISIVTPMYNESEMVNAYFENMNKTVADIQKKDASLEFEIVVVNDGSRDNTFELLKERVKVQKNLKVVNLSRNFGQEPAVFAGVESSSGDAIIVMDCDMQDPPELIEKLIEKWQEGYDVVNAKRANRKTDSFFKRNTAKFYYKTINKLNHRIKYPENVNNFRLISRNVADLIKTFPSKEKFFRNAVVQAGFKTVEVDFTRQLRAHGKSKINLSAMLRLAFAGIADTSVKPLHFSFIWSIVFICLGGLGSLSAIIFGILNECSVEWAGILCNSILFVGCAFFFVMMLFSGIIMLFLGINSYYLGKAYTEIKGYPMYTIEGVYSAEK